MSDTFTGMTPEEQAAMSQGLLRYGGIMLPRYGAAALNNIMPNPDLPGPLGYVPGTNMALGAGALGGTLYGLAKSAAQHGMNTEALKHVQENTPEWAQSAGKLVSDNEQRLMDVVPHIDPASSGEKLADAVAGGLGGMTSIIPAGLVNVLPKAVRVAGHFVVPQKEHMIANVPIGGAVSGGLEAASQALEPQSLDDWYKEQDKANPNPVDIINTPTSLSAPDGTGPPSLSLISSAQAAQPTTVATSQTPAAGGFNWLGDTPELFDKQGESDWTTLDTIKAIGAATLAIGTAKYVHGLGSKIGAAERDARIGDKSFQDKIDAYENQPTQAGANVNPIGQAPIPVPVPTTTSKNPVRAVGNEIGQSMLDDQTRVLDHLRAIAPDEDAFKMLSDKHYNNTSHGSVQNKLAEFYRTGIDPVTGRSVPSPTDLFSDISNLPKDKLELLDSALHAGDEVMDNRPKMFRDAMAEAKKTGVMTPQQDLRFNLWNKTDDQLRYDHFAGTSDPVVGPIMERYYDIVRGMPDILRGRELITTDALNRIHREHPHFVPSAGLEGKLLHDFTPRNLETRGGNETPNVRAWEALDNYLDKIIPDIYKNDNNRMLRDSIEQYQNSRVGLPKILEEIHVPAGGEVPSGAKNPIVAVHDASGTKHYIVDEPTFYDAMRTGSHAQQRATLNGLDIARRALQTSTTGAASLMTGRLFPGTNAIRTNLMSMINMPHEMYPSILDRAIHERTGQRYRGWLGNLPTAGAHTVYAGIADQVANIAHNVAGLIRPESTSSTNKFMRSLLHPSIVDDLHNWLRNQYMNSILHEQRTRGLGGQGSAFARTLEGQQMRMKGGGLVSRTTGMDQVPRLFAMETHIKGVPATMRAWNAVTEAYSLASDAGHSAAYRANRNVPRISPEKLSVEIRRLTGDPTRRGGSRIMQTASRYMPYLNVSAQGASRLAEGISRPGSAFRAAMGHTDLALLSLMSALHHKDRDAALEELNNMSTYQIGANPTFWFNKDVKSPVRLNLPQEERWIHSLAMMLTSKMFTTEGMQHNGDYATSVGNWLRNYFGQHVNNANLEAYKHSLNDYFNPAGLPSPVEAALNLAGSSGSFDLARAYNDWKDGTLSWKTFIHSKQFKPQGPNQPDGGDSILDSADMQKFGNAASHLYGLLGTAMEMARGGMHSINKHEGFWDVLKQTAAPLGQAAGDKNPEISWLWGNQIRTPSMTPLAEGVERTLRQLDKTSGSTSALKAPDMTSAGRYGIKLENPAQDGKLPTDPTMLRMYRYEDQWNQQIKTRYMQPINQLRTKIQDINNGTESPDIKRQRINEVQDQIQKLYARVGANLTLISNGLSKIAGRPVDVRQNIDWNGTVDQFH